MEGLSSLDGFIYAENLIDLPIENFEGQNAEKLIYDLIYGGDFVGDKEPNSRTIDERMLRVEVILAGMKSMIREWHDLIKPKYIILNETSAVPFGYVFKEIWRIAYPDEQLPKFYRIDPRFITDDMSIENAKLVYDFIKKRFDDVEANTIIFDEASISGSSLRRVRNGLCEFNEYLSSVAGFLAGRDEEIEIIKKESDELEKTFENLRNIPESSDRSEALVRARELVSTLYYRKNEAMRRIRDKIIQDNPILKREKIFLYGGFGSRGQSELQNDSEKSFRTMIENPREGIKPTKKVDQYGSGGLQGRIKKGIEGRIVLENIKKLKKLGILLGQEMKEEADQK
jgi:hypothetical protein